MASNELRVGQGIDIHRFAPGRKLILGGVEIPSELGLEGHSDADVLLHALMDALLGAAGHGDIGTFFPNTDQRWKNASSLDLLARVWQIVGGEGWRVVNLDLSLLAEKPKVAPHIPDMKKKICRVLEIDPAQCGIKATTSEGLGYIGRAEGVAAFSVVLLERERS